MAYYKGYRSYGRTTKGTKNNGYSETEKLAYRMGCINRGLNNPDSKVYESFVNGLNGVTSKQKEKPMF